MSETDHLLALLRGARDAGLDRPSLQRVRTRVELAVQHEIDAEARGGRRRAAAPRGRRWPIGLPVVPVLSVAVTVAVVAAALVLLGGRGPVSNQPRVTGTGPSTTADTVGALQSELSILRRPQRQSDRLSARAITAEEQCPTGLCIAPILTRETRLLATIPVRDRAAIDHRERFYLILGAIPRTAPAWRQHGRARDGVHLSLVAVTRGLGDRVAFTALLPNYASQPMPRNALNPRDVVITTAETVGVVPDGVTRVKWELANPGQTQPAIVYPHVKGNIASAPWTPAPRSTALINEQWLVGATWYAANGQTIASFHQSLTQLGRR